VGNNLTKMRDFEKEKNYFLMKPIIAFHPPTVIPVQIMDHSGTFAIYIPSKYHAILVSLSHSPQLKPQRWLRKPLLSTRSSGTNQK
jgi:hypothetical protein